MRRHRVPGRLGHAVHAVDHVDGHEILAAHASRGPRAVQGQHHHRHVYAHPVQLGRAKRAQVDRGVLPHAEAVQTDDPGPVVPALGPRHPDVHGPVGLVLEPPRPAGFLGMRLPPAREGGVLVAQPVGGLVDRPHVVGRRGVAVVGRRVVNPPRTAKTSRAMARSAAAGT